MTAIILSAREVVGLRNGSISVLRRPVNLHDKRDVFVGVCGFHAAHKDKSWFRFHHWNAESDLQGNGEPRPDYAIKGPMPLGSVLTGKDDW